MNRYLDLAAIEELRQIIKQKAIIIEMLDVLNYNFTWLLRFCDKNNIEIPDRERLYNSTNKLREFIDQLAPPTDMQQPNKTTEDATVY